VDCLKRFMKAIVSPEVTIEQEYTSLILDVDRCQHPLLHELDSVVDLAPGETGLSAAHFSRVRLSIIESALFVGVSEYNL
jgi:hypothetical protein